MNSRKLLIPLLAAAMAQRSQAVLIVADTGANAIRQFDESTGKFLVVYASGIGDTYGYNGIAIDGDDHVFVSDGVSYSIQGSTDMNVWTDAVTGIVGQGRVKKVFVETGDTHRFFRLVTN